MRAERVRREKMAAESAALKAPHSEAKGKRLKKAAAVAMNSDPSGSEQQQG